MADLILKGGRVIDPANGRDEIADIAFADGKVAEIGPDLPRRRGRDRRCARQARRPRPRSTCTRMSIGAAPRSGSTPPRSRGRSGTTTFVDAGSSGPGNFHGFRRHVIEPSPVRILPFLNVSFPGIFAFSGDGDGRRMRRSAPDRSARMRARDQRQPRPDRRGQGAGRARRRRRFRDRAARHRARSRRGDRAAGDGASRPSAAVAARGRCRGCARATSSPIASGRSRTRRCAATGGFARR